MMELKITISAPELSAALSELAKAIQGRPCPAVKDTDPEEKAGAAPVPDAYQKLGEYVEKMTGGQQFAYTPASVPTQMPAPEPRPVPVAPMPAPEPQPVPVAPMPAPEPQPIPAAPVQAAAPAVHIAPASDITITQIARAGAALVDKGKKAEVIGALRRFGVQAVTQLKPEQFGLFASELRALGAQI